MLFITTQKQKNYISTICPQNKDKKCRKQTYAYQGGKGGGINWEVGTDIYTLLYIK